MCGLHFILLAGLFGFSNPTLSPATASLAVNSGGAGPPAPASMGSSSSGRPPPPPAAAKLWDGRPIRPPTASSSATPAPYIVRSLPAALRPLSPRALEDKSKQTLGVSPYAACPAGSPTAFMAAFCPYCQGSAKGSYWVSDFTKCPVVCGGAWQAQLSPRCFGPGVTPGSPPALLPTSRCNATCAAYINSTAQFCAAVDCANATVAVELTPQQRADNYSDVLARCPPQTEIGRAHV